MKINSLVFDEIQHIKCLGFLVDNKLNWSLEYICKKKYAIDSNIIQM